MSDDMWSGFTSPPPDVPDLEQVREWARQAMQAYAEMYPDQPMILEAHYSQYEGDVRDFLAVAGAVDEAFEE